MSDEPILLSTREGVATLTLNRPKALNSLNRPLIEAIRNALRALAKDSSVRVLVMTGAGRGFCAGADLASNEFQDGVERTAGESIGHSMEIAFNPLISDLLNFPKPVIAAVNGVAAGGGVSLALGCDIVVAAQSAYFSQVFGPRLNLVPDMGCTWLAPRIVGRARARALALLGDRIPADIAAQWGMIWMAVPDDKLTSEVDAIAARLAKGPPAAFAKIKTVLEAADYNSFEEQLELERRVQTVLGDTHDTREGMVAFLQKREPKFTGT